MNTQFHENDPRQKFHQNWIEMPCTMPPVYVHEVLTFLESSGNAVEAALFRRAVARDVAVAYLAKIGGARSEETRRLRPEFNVFARGSVLFKSFGKVYRVFVSAVEENDPSYWSTELASEIANSLPREPKSPTESKE